MTIELANRLAELRKQKGLSQEELADKLQVSRQAISKWERGEASPDTDNLIELAKIYGISLDELVGLSSPKEETKDGGIFINDEGVHISGGGKIHIKDDDGSEVEINSEEIRVTDEKGKTKVIHPNHEYNKFMALISSVITLSVVITYLILGSVWGLWAQAWPLFILVIVIPSIFEAFVKRKPYKFNYAAFVVFLYFLLNCWILSKNPLWHPLWIMFVTIPVYYAITSIIKSKDKDKIIVNPKDDD